MPAVGSISMTLTKLRTETTVAQSNDDQDHFILNGKPQSDPRVFNMLTQIRERSNRQLPMTVESTNFVPTASGLASSASGAAALGAAAWTLCSGDSGWEAVQDIIRIGSGSAPRSLLGGLVELERQSGSVRQLSAPTRWPLSMVVAQLSDSPKKTASRDGMQHTKDTSIFYDSWVSEHSHDLNAARDAIENKDIEHLGLTMERSTMRMHACMLAADPPLIYWNHKTLSIIDAVHQMRATGVGAWYTMDAGPHVKILCEPSSAHTVETCLVQSELCHAITVDHIGQGIAIR